MVYSSQKSTDFLLNPFCLKLETIYLSACIFAVMYLYKEIKFKPNLDRNMSDAQNTTYCILQFSEHHSYSFQFFGLILYISVNSFGHVETVWPQGYKLFSCSPQLSTKFIMLINVKMPTIVGNF